MRLKTDWEPALSNTLCKQIKPLSCVCVGHTGELYKNGWTDQDAVRENDLYGSKQPLDGSPDTHWKGHLWGICAGLLQREHRVWLLTLTYNLNIQSQLTYDHDPPDIKLNLTGRSFQKRSKTNGRSDGRTDGRTDGRYRWREHTMS